MAGYPALIYSKSGHISNWLSYFSGRISGILPDSGSVDFWPAGSGSVTFSSDPDHTCNNGYIELILSWTKYKPVLTNSSIIKWWFIKLNFMLTYLKYKYSFFFISYYGQTRSWIQIRFFSQLSQIRIRGKNNSDSLI